MAAPAVLPRHPFCLTSQEITGALFPFLPHHNKTMDVQHTQMLRTSETDVLVLEVMPMKPSVAVEALTRASMSYPPWVQNFREGERSGCAEEVGGARFISTAGRQCDRARRVGMFSPRRRRLKPTSTRPRATTALETTSRSDFPGFARSVVYVHGWQPRPPFLTCTERSLRSRPPGLLHHNDPLPPNGGTLYGSAPGALLGSFVHHDFQQPPARYGGVGLGAEANSLADELRGRPGHHGHPRYHQHSQRRQQQQEHRHVCHAGSVTDEACSTGGRGRVPMAGSCWVTPRSIGDDVCDDDLTSNGRADDLKQESASDCLGATPTDATSGQASGKPDDVRLEAISAWWVDCIANAAVCASAYRTEKLDAGVNGHLERNLAVLLVETLANSAFEKLSADKEPGQGQMQSSSPAQPNDLEANLAVSLVETIVHTACRNAQAETGPPQRQEESSSSLIQSHNSRVSSFGPAPEPALEPKLASDPYVSDENMDTDAEKLVLPRSGLEDPTVAPARRHLVVHAAAKEFVTETTSEDFLRSVSMAIAAAQRPTTPASTLSGGGKLSLRESAETAASSVLGDRIDHDIAMEGVEEQSEEDRMHQNQPGQQPQAHQHQQQQQQQPTEVGYDGDEGVKIAPGLDVAPASSSVPLYDGTAWPSPTLLPWSESSSMQLMPSCDTTIASGADAAHPAGIQVHFPAPVLVDHHGQIGSPKAATGGIATEQCASRLAAAAADQGDGRSPPLSSRKRLRNGTFVRITNLPVKNNAIAVDTLRYDAADRRGEAKCLRSSAAWPRRVGREGPAAETPVEGQHRPRTAVLEAGHRNGTDTPSSVDLALPRAAKSAETRRGTAGAAVKTRSGSGRGARVQLRRNRWCSPSIDGDRGGGAHAPSCSLLTSVPGDSCGDGHGGCRELLSPPGTDVVNLQRSLIVMAAPPHRPPLCLQPHHTSAVHGSVGKRADATDHGSSGVTRTTHILPIGEGAGGQTASDPELNLASIASSERLFPPVQYQYKNQGPGVHGRTELTAAADVVTTAAAEAVAAASVATEREASRWRGGSSSTGENGTERGSGAASPAECDSRGGSAGGVGTGGMKGWPAKHGPGRWRVVPPPGDRPTPSARSPREVMHRTVQPPSRGLEVLGDRTRFSRSAANSERYCDV